MAANPKTPGEPKQNLTLQLPTRVIRRLRVLAAKRGVSVSQLVGDNVWVMEQHAEDYQRAMRRALERMEVGYNLGGGPLPKREELYDPQLR